MLLLLINYFLVCITISFVHIQNSINGTNNMSKEKDRVGKNIYSCQIIAASIHLMS
jgi:hypothetical protein